MKRQRPTLIALALTAASLALPCVAVAADSPMKQVNGRLYFGADATVAATRDDYKFVTPYAPGWNMQFGLALNNWPLSLGLSAGVYRLSGSSVDGGLQANVSNGDFIIGTTTFERSVDVRHADLVLRFEPQWILFRPFAEATIGTAQFFTQSSKSVGGEVVREGETARDLSYLLGASAGVAIEPFRPFFEDERGTLSVAFNFGVRWSKSGDLHYPDSVDTNLANNASIDGPVRLVSPYVGIYIVSRSPNVAARMRW